MSNTLNWAYRNRLMGKAIQFEFCDDEKAPPTLGPLFDALDLSFLDYVTLRDLFQLTGQKAETPLVAVLLVLLGRLAGGSLCLRLEAKSLVDQMQGGMDRQTAQTLVNAFLAQMKNGTYRKLVAEAADPVLPLVSTVTKDHQLLYFQKYFLHEARLNQQIFNYRRQSAPLDQEHPQYQAITQALYTPDLALRSGPTNIPLAKDDLQVKAIQMALAEPFVIISGGPGTGKTSLTVNIIRALLLSGIDIAQVVLCAPTGRAAQRMTEAVHRSIDAIEKPSDEDRAMLTLVAHTLHRTLRYSPRQRDFFYGPQRPLPASVVIMDEASMVDVALMDAFLQSLRPEHTKLILLGDKDQLPSVEAGTVFADMVPSTQSDGYDAQRMIVLENTYRAGERLHALAGKINAGAMPVLTATTLDQALAGSVDSWHWVDFQDNESWYRLLRQWAQHFYLSTNQVKQPAFKRLLAQIREMPLEQLINTASGRRLLEPLFAVVEQARILCLTKNGLAGCHFINRFTADYLADQMETPPPANAAYGPGTLILVTRNDPDLDLYNGDLGILLSDRKNGIWACFRRGGAYVIYPLAQLPAWELGFATTVHKSQGSEFANVLLVMPENEAHRLLSREIIYTGVTRAQKKLIIYGRRGALQNALGKRIDRESGSLGAVLTDPTKARSGF